MFRTILAGFGYCKVSKDVVMLSVAVETQLKKAIDGKMTYGDADLALKAASTITTFLRSGKAINSKEA